MWNENQRTPLQAVLERRDHGKEGSLAGGQREDSEFGDGFSTEGYVRSRD